MIKLSYSTFGLTDLSFLDAVDAVDKAGYPGIELSFHRDQFNPFNVTDDEIDTLKRKLQTTQVKAACLATASHFFTPSRPHEPSLMSIDLAGRKRRIGLVKRGIEVARKLGVPLVTFGSGFIRDEHIANPTVNPRELLVDSIQHCLEEIRDEDMTLLIEPEPGMFIETVDQAMSLVDEVNSPQFRLHLDMCHMYCSEADYISALGKAAPYTRYFHVSDAEEGCNLKIVKMDEDLKLDLSFANYLVYFPDSADFLLVDAKNPICFYDRTVTHQQEKQIQQLLESVNVQKAPAYVDYNSLYAGATPLDDEIFTYLISIPQLSFDVLERARQVIVYLRTARNEQGQFFMDKMVANSLTGIVHYHEIPGEGTLDFAASFNALTENGFSGYASVELYHHVRSWKKALDDSFRHLSQHL